MLVSKVWHRPLENDGADTLWAGKVKLYPEQVSISMRKNCCPFQNEEGLVQSRGLVSSRNSAI